MSEIRITKFIQKNSSINKDTNLISPDNLIGAPIVTKSEENVDEEVYFSEFTEEESYQIEGASISVISEGKEEMAEDANIDQREKGIDKVNNIYDGEIASQKEKSLDISKKKSSLEWDVSYIEKKLSEKET
mmetsp:Transcript_2819/g.2894  ORF Transcript_2819/g.2894 Transcript_2819/m.2894 type:complete len:131 (-) Transcript_2819:43-435(-)